MRDAQAPASRHRRDICSACRYVPYACRSPPPIPRVLRDGSLPWPHPLASLRGGVHPCLTLAPGKVEVGCAANVPHRLLARSAGGGVLCWLVERTVGCAANVPIRLLERGGGAAVVLCELVERAREDVERAREEPRGAAFRQPAVDSRGWRANDTPVNYLNGRLRLPFVRLLDPMGVLDPRL